MEYKRAIACIIAIFISISLSSATGIGFGAKGGVNIANVHGDQAYYWGNKIGFCAGAFLNIDLGKVIKIQPELLYIQKGGKYYPPAPFVTILILDYLEMPVVVKAEIPSQSKTKFNFFTGPYLAYNAVAKARLENDTLPDDELEEVNDFDMGFVVGAGLDLPLSIGKISLDARYEVGFLQVFDLDYFDFKNDGYSFTLGYMFK